jgi:nucleotide-binding universal stress UspA family protein
MREAAVNVRPSILCPIDFSDASAGALRHAAAIAEHFVTRLIVLSVESPLLAATLDIPTRPNRTREVSEGEVARFVSRVFGELVPAGALCEHEVAMGKPAAEILRVARERSCDLIVMSSHGHSGPAKWLLGSTTERVLRDTTLPVLVTPAVDLGGVAVEDAARWIGEIVVPIDLSPASRHQLFVAMGLAEALGLRLVIVHALDLSGAEAARREEAALAVEALIDGLPATAPHEVLIVSGEPPAAISRVVTDRRAGLIVMGLHEGRHQAPRMGSVTYRTLCGCSSVVLALPPQLTSRSVGPRERGRADSASVGAGSARRAGASGAPL